MKNNDTYDWFNPIDGEYTVIVDREPVEDALGNPITQEYCVDMKYGYHTYRNSWKEGEPVIDNVERMMPDYLLELRKVDQSNTVWYPMYVNTIGVILYLAPKSEGSDEMDWYCQAAVPVSSEIQTDVNLTEDQLSQGIFATPVNQDGEVKYLLQQPGTIIMKRPFDEFEEVYGKFNEVYRSYFNQEEE